MLIKHLHTSTSEAIADSRGNVGDKTWIKMNIKRWCESFEKKKNGKNAHRKRPNGLNKEISRNGHFYNFAQVEYFVFTFSRSSDIHFSRSILFRFPFVRNSCLLFPYFHLVSCLIVSSSILPHPNCCA